MKADLSSYYFKNKITVGAPPTVFLKKTHREAKTDTVAISSFYF
jgi:hypothetical protein